MSVFAYSLAKYRPELYTSCLFPSTDPIPVSYEGKHLCNSDISAKGVIEMEIPEDVIKRIETGRMVVEIHNTSIEREPAVDHRRARFKIIEIEMYDRD